MDDSGLANCNCLQYEMAHKREILKNLYYHWFFSLTFLIHMYLLVSAGLSYEKLIIPNIIRGFGMAVLFIGILLYALGNLPPDSILRAAAVLIIVRTMIEPGLWSIAFNYIDGIWKLEALTNLVRKIEASAYSEQKAMGLYRTINLDALMIATKRIYGLLIMVGASVLIYVSLLNFDGLNTRRLMLLKKRLKGKSVKGYIRDVEIKDEETMKEEVKAASAVAV